MCKKINKKAHPIRKLKAFSTLPPNFSIRNLPRVVYKANTTAAAAETQSPKLPLLTMATGSATMISPAKLSTRVIAFLLVKAS